MILIVLNVLDNLTTPVKARGVYGKYLKIFSSSFQIQNLQIQELLLEWKKFALLCFLKVGMFSRTSPQFFIQYSVGALSHSRAPLR